MAGTADAALRSTGGAPGGVSGVTPDTQAALEAAAAAAAAGEPILLPTDTVYGLCAAAGSEAAVRRAYALKGRGAVTPSAVIASSVDLLVDLVPELAGRSEQLLRALVPGPFTLVVPNPRGRLPWLCGGNPATIGLRVPALDGVAALALEGTGPVMATSANEPGGPDPRSLHDVPGAIRDGCAAEVDGGVLPGVPSTVVDCVGEPRVLREGAVTAAETLARVAAALA